MLVLQTVREVLTIKKNDVFNIDGRTSRIVSVVGHWVYYEARTGAVIWERLEDIKNRLGVKVGRAFAPFGWWAFTY